ncbi:MAG: hypothetical protein Q8L14_24495 [Myxococcales bacterium]|nr:hypothetical protein [Myxococcales bacterium]
MARRFFVAMVVMASTALAGPAWEKKVQDFRQQTQEQRKKLGLKNDTKDPTPELAFAVTPGESTNGMVVLCPGQSVDVKLKTNLPAGSLFVATTDDVTISNEKFGSGTWAATLTAKPTILPRPFEIQGVQAGSGRAAYLGSFLLGCKHTLLVDVEGARLTAKLDFTSGRRSIAVPGTWTKDSKALGTANYTISLNTNGLSVSQLPTEADGQAQMKAMMASMESPERKALEGRLQKATAKMGPCGKVPQDKMAACYNAVQPELNAINAEMKKLNDAADLANAPKFGCSELSLNFTANAALEGDATRCAAKKSNDRVSVKGSITTP